MRPTTSAVLMMAVAVCLCAQQPSASVAGNAPLTQDQIAVCRAFLSTYTNGASTTLNLGNKTMPLELSDADGDDCLKGIAFRDLALLRSRSRELSPEVVAGTDARLVDPERQTSAVKANDPSTIIRGPESVEGAVRAAFASALLQVSEVAFDRSHRYAVLSFSFSCGRLCGHGGTLVFEKAKGRWKASKRRCSTWIS